MNDYIAQAKFVRQSGAERALGQLIRDGSQLSEAFYIDAVARAERSGGWQAAAMIVGIALIHYPTSPRLTAEKRRISSEFAAPCDF